MPRSGSPKRAARERRLERKSHNARTKRLRNKPGWDE
jgi:hypothetical protein